jgi:hypothetical protein
VEPWCVVDLVIQNQVLSVKSWNGGIGDGLEMGEEWSCIANSSGAF